MATIAQTAQITATIGDETFGISDLIVARVRRDIRPRDWRGRPYAIWRAEEHAYWNANAWARMISEYPLASGAHQSRSWNVAWKTPERRPSIVAEDWRLRDVGPRDALGGGRSHGVGRQETSPSTSTAGREVCAKCHTVHYG